MAIALRIGEEVELVALRRPPRDARALGLVPLVHVRRPAGVGSVKRSALRCVEELAGRLPLVAPLPIREVEPHLVLLDRPAERRAAVKDIADMGHGRKASAAQRIGQVVALHAAAGIETVRAAREDIGALLGDQVDLDAVGVGVGRDAARREHRFLHGLLVLVVALVPLGMLNPHAVELDDLAALTVIRAADLAGVATGYVEALVAFEARRERHKVIQVLHAARQHVQQVAGDERLLADVLRVHQGGRARHRDCLFEGADFHLGIDRRRESRRQVDAFPLEGAEAG